MDPSGPAQPRLDQSYEVTGNAATKAAPEQLAAAKNRAAPGAGEIRTGRRQGDISDATPSSLGYGITGAPPGEETRGYTNSDQFRGGDLDGEQMRAPGEGDVTRAVNEKPGATGEQPDLASDLDAKKAEQAPLRAAVDQQKKHDVDVGGILGQRGGPANSNS